MSSSPSEPLLLLFEFRFMFVKDEAEDPAWVRNRCCGFDFCWPSASSALNKYSWHLKNKHSKFVGEYGFPISYQ